MTEKPPDRSVLLSAHNRGLLAFLTKEVTEAPPPGEPGTTAAARRAGWMSGKAAMGGEDG